jgi:hypothetical protein
MRAVVGFSVFESIVRVPREFRLVYEKAASDVKRIKAWHNKFLETYSKRNLEVIPKDN